MKILYASSAYVPSRRASAVQVTKMCNAMAEEGHSVVLLTKDCPPRQEQWAAGPHAFYGLKPRFEIRPLPRPVQKGGGLLFALSTFATLHRSATEADLVYTRDPLTALSATRAGVQTLFEAHEPPHSDFEIRCLRALSESPRFRRLVTISGALRDELQSKGFAPKDGDVVVAHDATGAPKPVKPANRAKEKFTVGYVGSLYPGRGIEVLFELGERLPEVAFSVVGGRDHELAHWRKIGPPKNVELRGFVPHADLSKEYERFDAVVLPYTSGSIEGASGGDIGRWMSPMKLFEYMGSGLPIVSTDLPVLREILEHERNALMVPVGDIGGWVKAIQRLVDDPALANALSTAATTDVATTHTWPRRAQTVLAGLSETTP